MIKVKDLKTLKALQNHSEGELALVERGNKIYVYKEDKWVKYDPKDGGLTVSLYDVNKMAMLNMPDLTEEQIDEAKKMIANFVSRDSTFWMLLNNEKRYYTVFQLTKNKAIILIKNIEDEVIDCLQEIGTIRSIEQVDENTIEAWVIDKMDSEAYAYYLFNYDKGVVICR